ncbi:MAG: hypothetical protein O2856_15845 [Planctomycetota bacterium]|nr:hypothetical protein [Planctomycetota bacterium]
MHSNSRVIGSGGVLAMRVRTLLHNKQTTSTMFRKTIAALMLIAAVATAIEAVPGVMENIAFACDGNTGLGCD